MLNDTYDTCDIYDTFRDQNKILTPVNKQIRNISFIYAEKFVPLQCRNKDGISSLGQPEFCFRPARFYGLPSAQKIHQEIGIER